MLKSLEDLNIQLRNVKNSEDLKQLVMDILNSKYELVHHDKYASLGCQNLGMNTYDIVIDDEENKSKFLVYGYLERVNKRSYKTMYKYFSIKRPLIIAYDDSRNPEYEYIRNNIIQ